MKKFYILVLLFTGLTGFAFSPPVITPPSDYTTCEGNIFSLHSKDGEILGGLNPALYTVTYFLTDADAQTNSNPIANPDQYDPLMSQLIYVRVEDNTNPADYSVTSFNLTVIQVSVASINGPTTVCGGNDITIAFQASYGLEPYTFTYSVNGGPVQTVQSTSMNSVGISLPIIASGTYDVTLISVANAMGCPNIINFSHHIDVLPSPTAGQPNNLFVEDIPFDGSAVFNLTSNDALLENGQTDASVAYYLSNADAQSEVNPIVGANNFVGTNGQVIWAVVGTSISSCKPIKSFTLYVTNPDIVFIPDPNFKARLLAANGGSQIAQDLAHNFTVVDTNGDGEIEYSEAHNISLLDASQSSITDFTGLEAFINVQYLNTSYNFQATSINTTTMPLLADLTTSHCALTSLNLGNNHVLQSINCEYNNLLSLDFSTCPFMNSIHCQNNQLTILDIHGLTQLTDLLASDNYISTIYTADLHSIITLNIAANTLTSLPLTGLSTLQQLICEHNLIDSIDTAGCTSLTTLRCAYNQMTYLDVSNSLLLTGLDCSANTLILLDLSHNSALCSLNCSGNITMNWLNIKNGVDSCYTNFNVLFINNVLQQFCCDDNEVEYFKNYFMIHQGIDVNVNSYCSFIPGGNYNTIAGTMTFDADNNGCDSNDDIQSNIRVDINDGTTTGASFTSNTGAYTFYTQAGSFDVTPAVENQSWFTFSPTTATIPFTDTNNNTVTQNFCMTANGSHQDLEMVMAPITPARPGFDAVYKLVYRNKGNTIMGPSTAGIILKYDIGKLTYVSSSQPVTATGTNSINFEYPLLLPFASGSIEVTFHVNSPVDAPAVNIGDVLQFMTMISPNNNDENIPDNTFFYNQTVVGSFDPNDITCLEGDLVSPTEIGKYLHYSINFENTGTADAENIVVKDIIDTTQYDVSTLQVLNSSNPVTAKLTGNVAEFIFKTINLHSGGHGNILLKIKSNSSLVQGDSVSKKADIFFDYNAPISTTMANTTFETLSNPSVPIDASISIYPNPTKSTMTVNSNNTIKSVEVYDIQGRVLQTKLINEVSAIIDITTYNSGIYFVKVTSDKGMKVEKVVKE